MNSLVNPCQFIFEISHGIEKSSNEAIIFYGICFVLFRFFDIAKPFPVNCTIEISKTVLE